MQAVQDQSATLPPNYRAMKLIVIVLGVLLVLGFVGLITAMVMGVGRRAPATRTTEPYITRLVAPQSARISGAQLDGNRLIVQIDDGQGSVAVIEAATGRVLGRVMLGPPQ